MSDYASRAREEYTQLEDRVDKLAAFIGSPAFTELDPQEQGDLEQQLSHMHGYVSVLARRVARMPPA